jgi:predicted RecA/RadA family phage recombinase
MEAIFKKSLASGRQFTLRTIATDTEYAQGEVILFTGMLGIVVEKAGGANKIAAAKLLNSILPDCATIMLEHELVEIAKEAPLVISLGDKVYWDVADNVVNKTASGNYLCGTCVKAAASADTTVEIMYDGRVVTVGA